MIKKIYNILLKEYGSQGWWPLNEKYSTKLKLNDKEKFEVALGAILTQSTSWTNVEKALENLRKNRLLDINNIRLVETKKLALLIKSSWYNNQKARKIKEYIRFLDSKIDINRENLLSVWGVGKETADSILLYAYNKPFFVVDSYTKRIFSRLGFCKEDTSYDYLQELFHKNLPENSRIFNEYHALLVEHAKRYCKKKPLCSSCPLKLNCNFLKLSYETLIKQ